MKALVTGANGTVGKALAAYLEKQKITVIPWDRTKYPVNNFQKMIDFLSNVRPDVLFHLAIASKNTGLRDEERLVNKVWPKRLAKYTLGLGIKFVFTSSVMVFSDKAKGPFTINSSPDETDGYGKYKRDMESLLPLLNPNTIVIRLGWQIGKQAGSNNMIDFFEKQMEAEGQINASKKWLPACSFLDDTAAAILSISQMQPGIYMIDSNKKWNFFEIASALNKKHGNKWKVKATDDFIFDQRMIDERLQVPGLKQRLKSLD